MRSCRVMPRQLEHLASLGSGLHSGCMKLLKPGAGPQTFRARRTTLQRELGDVQDGNTIPQCLRGGVLETCRRHFRTSPSALHSQPRYQDLRQGYRATSCCDAHRNIALKHAFQRFDGILHAGPPRSKTWCKNERPPLFRRQEA